MRPFDVLTFGDLCVDLIISGTDVTPQFGQVEKLVGDYTLELGGSGSIFACQAARLGLRTAILGRVGADDFGRLVLRRLEECGVDTRFVTVDPVLKTGLGVALCPPGDRAILTYMGTIDALRPQEVSDDLLRSARHLHYGSYFLQCGLRPAAGAILRRARSLGLSLSLDTNWDPEERWAGLEELIPLVDIFMPNDQEALRISAKRSLDEAAAGFLAQGAGLVTLKAGAAGAAVYAPGGKWTRAVIAVQGGDSVGAGDSFDAGFLAGWLRGLGLERCLEIAAACGTSVAAQTGGLAGQLPWAVFDPTA